MLLERKYSIAISRTVSGLTDFSVVEQNLTSAVIFEDDIDWDVRIKDQLRDFATAAHILTQPLVSNGSYADPTFPIVQDSGFQPLAMDFEKDFQSQLPQVSPYGDNWDLLWVSPEPVGSLS